MSEVLLYRIENPNIPAKKHDPEKPLGSLTSHPDIVGQWFSPDVNTAVRYLRKSTQTFGKEAGPIDGARLVVARVPDDRLDEFHVFRHETASKMDVESDNYIIPRDGSVPIMEIPLDQTIGDLRGQLGNFNNFAEAQRRINELVESLGKTASNN